MEINTNLINVSEGHILDQDSDTLQAVEAVENNFIKDLKQSMDQPQSQLMSKGKGKNNAHQDGLSFDFIPLEFKNSVVVDFADKLKENFDLSVEEFIDAYKKLDSSSLMKPPKETIDSVIEKLSLAPADKKELRQLYVQFLNQIEMGKDSYKKNDEGSDIVPVSNSFNSLNSRESAIDVGNKTPLKDLEKVNDINYFTPFSSVNEDTNLITPPYGNEAFIKDSTQKEQIIQNKVSPSSINSANGSSLSNSSGLQRNYLEKPHDLMNGVSPFNYMNGDDSNIENKNLNQNENSKIFPYNKDEITLASGDKFLGLRRDQEFFDIKRNLEGQEISKMMKSQNISMFKDPAVHPLNSSLELEMGQSKGLKLESQLLNQNQENLISNGFNASLNLHSNEVNENETDKNIFNMERNLSFSKNQPDFIKNEFALQKQSGIENGYSSLSSNQRELGEDESHSSSDASKWVSFEDRSLKVADQVSKGFLLGTPKIDDNKSLNEVIHHTRFLVRQGGGEIKVQLDPPGLGQMTIAVAVDQGVVQVQMTAETKEAKKIIEGGLSDLKSILESHRLTVHGIKVDLAGEASNELRKDFNNSDLPQRNEAREFLNNFRQQNEERRSGFFNERREGLTLDKMDREPSRMRMQTGLGSQGARSGGKIHYIA